MDIRQLSSAINPALDESFLFTPHQDSLKLPEDDTARRRDNFHSQ